MNNVNTEGTRMGHRSAAEALAGTAMRPLWDDADESVRELVRCSLRDWLAVAVAGAGEPDVRLVATTVATADVAASAAATVIGGGRRASLRDAAFLDGLAGHVLDYDDTSSGPLEGHPSAVVLPPLLVAGEAYGMTVGEVLSAYTAGVQVADQLGSWVSPRHYARGWHATATIGSIAGAAATARLLELPVDVIAHAVALSATQVAGLRVSFGTPAKSLQVGRAASVAVDAALIAALGVSGPLPALDSHPAFEPLAGDSLTPSAEDGCPAVDGLAVEKTLIKWHAACHSTHAALEALARCDVPLAAIEKVEVGVRPDLLGVCGIQSPATGLELKFSIAGVVAMAMAAVDTSDPSAYGPDTLSSETWRGALQKVTVGSQQLSSEWQTALTVTLEDGSQRSVFVDLRDCATLPDTQHRLADKFFRLVSPALGRSAADDLWALLNDPDDVPVADVMAIAGAAA